jgi:hypothetical protein
LPRVLPIVHGWRVLSIDRPRVRGETIVVVVVGPEVGEDGEAVVLGARSSPWGLPIAWLEVSGDGLSSVPCVHFPSERGVLAAGQRDEMGFLGWK